MPFLCVILLLCGSVLTCRFYKIGSSSLGFEANIQLYFYLPTKVLLRIWNYHSAIFRRYVRTRTGLDQLLEPQSGVDWVRTGSCGLGPDWTIPNESVPYSAGMVGSL